MVYDFHGERKMILNENDSRAMSFSRFTIKRKRHKRNKFSKFSMFQNALIRNVAINIYGVEMLLFDNSVLKMYLNC